MGHRKGYNAMKIRNLKTWGIGPLLLLVPMMCGHLGDGHHMGYRQPGLSQQSHQSSTQSERIPGVTGEGGITIRQDSTDEK
jgi:hypothetical protein